VTSESNSLIPALIFEPDGYSLDGPRLMGRQAAGHGFLRAAIDGREGVTVAMLADRVGLELAQLIHVLAPLAKTGLVALRQRPAAA